jgi:predicted TIM-barrel fold metal-dependent hydrolase
VVGNLPLEDEAADKLIDRFARHRLFRGVRVNGDELLAGLDDARYRSHIARLAAIERAARLPHIFMKMSGLVESAAQSMKPAQAPRDPAFYEPWLAPVWKAFSAERVMYGSNWPVSDRAADYAAVHTIVAAFVRSHGAEAERWFFADTSRAAYRWA